MSETQHSALKGSETLEESALQRISWEFKRGTVNSTSWEWGLKEEVFSLVPLHTPPSWGNHACNALATSLQMGHHQGWQNTQEKNLDPWFTSQWANQACLTSPKVPSHLPVWAIPMPDNSSRNAGTRSHWQSVGPGHTLLGWMPTWTASYCLLRCTRSM